MDKVSEKIVFVRYDASKEREWNEFVASSRNSTFLFDRGYMDYHADRFRDFSLMAYRDSRLVALLPAALTDDRELISHPGLTYGGWILPPGHVNGADVLAIMEQLVEHCRKLGIVRIKYKPLPWIYAHAPSQEDLYALFRLGAYPSTVNLSSTIDLRAGWKFDMSKRQQVRKAGQYGFRYEESHDWKAFWALLESCLSERHNASPVHTLAEIEMLAARFPRSIRLFTASDEAGIQAGLCIYDMGDVAHSQYAATTPDGRKHYALTGLYHHLLTEVFGDYRYFDFGTSNEDGGRALNAGLLTQKFSMGGTGVAYQCYSIDL